MHVLTFNMLKRTQSITAESRLGCKTIKAQWQYKVLLLPDIFEKSDDIVLPNFMHWPEQIKAATHNPHGQNSTLNTFYASQHL